MHKILISVTAIGAALLALGVSPSVAQAKSSQTISAKQAKAIQQRQKKLDKAFSQVNINRVASLDDQTSHFVLTGQTDKVAAKLPHLYKTTKAFQVTNEFNHKRATLPAGTVVQAIDDGNGNVQSFNFENLNTSKQRLIQRQLGSVAGLHVVKQTNGIAKHPYTRTTAFAYKGSASLPTLYQIKGGLLRSANKYQIQVTANNYLTYYAPRSTSSLYTQAAKIKKFKRTHTSITFYLKKPLAGVKTTKVRQGKTYLYRAKLTMGHVFLDYDYSDPVGYALTINDNGKGRFGFDMSDLGNPYATQIDQTNGYWAYGYTSAQVAQSKAFVEGLYK